MPIFMFIFVFPSILFFAFVFLWILTRTFIVLFLRFVFIVPFLLTNFIIGIDGQTLDVAPEDGTFDGPMVLPGSVFV
jgi:hypothetical protein